MAKKKRPNRGKPKAKAAPSAPADPRDSDKAVAPQPAKLPAAHVKKIVPASVEQPAFWFGFEVSWAKLAVARVVLFGVLALDAVLQIRHAPRYGANDFNVAQLSFLDDMGPGRPAYGICQLVISAMLVFAAFGVATRVVLPIAAALYAWLYFGSQLDSYQHHYLVAILLALTCFVPWQRPSDATPSTMVRSWALRLLLVQLGIMYLWAAISKMDPVWVDGTTLGSQITGGMKSMIEGTVGFKVASFVVILVELALAFTVWMRPAWKFAAPLGLLFHIGIVATGFEIGLFAYVMCALYILVVPDRIWIALGESPSMRAVGEATRKLGGLFRVALVLAMAAGIPLALANRLPHVIGVWLACALFAIAIAGHALVRLERRDGTALFAVLVAALLWTVVDRGTTVAIDYYRFWGGSQRRVGDRDQAEQAYRGMLAIDPYSEIAHFYLGRILLATDRAEEGLKHLHEAQLEPGRARAFLEEARYLARKGQKAEAIAKARDGVFADPSDSEVKTFLDQLQGGAEPGRPRKPDQDDD